MKHDSRGSRDELSNQTARRRARNQNGGDGSGDGRNGSAQGIHSLRAETTASTKKRIERYVLCAGVCADLFCRTNGAIAGL